MAADAVAFEPVSTAKFPANREKNREFFNSKHSSRLRWPTSPMISVILSKIPYSREQGIISTEQEISVQEQGILSVKTKIIAR